MRETWEGGEDGGAGTGVGVGTGVGESPFFSCFCFKELSVLQQVRHTFVCFGHAIYWLR